MPLKTTLYSDVTDRDCHGGSICLYVLIHFILNTGWTLSYLGTRFPRFCAVVLGNLSCLVVIARPLSNPINCNSFCLGAAGFLEAALSSTNDLLLLGDLNCDSCCCVFEVW